MHIRVTVYGISGLLPLILFFVFPLSFLCVLYDLCGEIIIRSFMKKIIVTGSGPGIGKTVVSAVLTTLLAGDYWKPIECCDEMGSDSQMMKRLINTRKHRIHPSAYSLKAPLSPHHAARLENKIIEPEHILLPQTYRPLVIETAGGIFVPLTKKFHNLDLFKQWQGHWIVVSKHYLGSINHTLLTIETLQRHNVSVLGILFNGEPNPDSEEAILQISHLPFLGRLLPETTIDRNTIQRYAKKWKVQLEKIVLV